MGGVGWLVGWLVGEIDKIYFPPGKQLAWPALIIMGRHEKYMLTVRSFFYLIYITVLYCMTITLCHIVCVRNSIYLKLRGFVVIEHVGIHVKQRQKLSIIN